MLEMQQRAVTAVRDWNDKLGKDATYLICSHGDVIKAILADALGMHLDMSQRIQVDPCSLSVIRYTTLRPFVLRMNDTGSDSAGLARRPPQAKSGAEADAQIGGGAGGVPCLAPRLYRPARLTACHRSPLCPAAARGGPSPP